VAEAQRLAPQLDDAVEPRERRARRRG